MSSLQVGSGWKMVQAASERSEHTVRWQSHAMKEPLAALWQLFGGDLGLTLGEIDEKAS